MPGHMYDPRLQRVLLERLARWGSLPQGDLLGMLSAEDRLKYRPDALLDLAWEGLVEILPSGDEPVVRITDAGRQQAGIGGAPGPRNGEVGGG